MQKRLMDILADPDNPEIWPLKLNEFKVDVRERKTFPKTYESSQRLCRFYCYKNDVYLVSDPLGDHEQSLAQEKIDKIVSIDDCRECFTEEIIDGVIYHEKNDKLKWFIIDDEIPVMFPLALRDEKQERVFINKFEKECRDLGIESPYSK